MITPKSVLLKKVSKARNSAFESSEETYQFAPRPIRKIFEEDTFKGYSENVFIVTDLFDCPRKLQLKILMDRLGAREKRTPKSLWATFRGSKIWDRTLSEMFEKSQVLFTVVMHVEGETVFVRGRIDALYVDEDGRLEVIDFKSVADKALEKKRYLKDNYILQVAFYAHVVGAEKYSILAVSNGGFRYASMDDASLKEQAYAYARKIIEEVVRAMKSGEVTKIKEMSACLYCPFRGMCDEIKTEEDLEEVLQRLSRLGKIEFH